MIMCILQYNRTPFQQAVYWERSGVVSLFVNKYKVDIKQYDEVTKVHDHVTSYICSSFNYTSVAVL